jgi:hypothetical protein
LAFAVAKQGGVAAAGPQDREHDVLHQTALKLLEAAGATVVRTSPAGAFQADLNGHQLRWGTGSRHHLRGTRYRAKGDVHQGPGRLRVAQRGGRRRTNARLVKEFIQEATAREASAGSIQVAIGPDATHKHLAPSVRVACWARPQGPTYHSHDEEVIARAQAAIDAGAVGIFVDWLRDNALLAHGNE